MKNNIIKISVPLILIFSLMVSFSGCNEKDTDNKSKTYKTVVNDNSENNTISESEKDTQSNFVDTSSASSSGKQLVASNSASSNNKNEIKSSKSQIKSVVSSSKQTTSAKVNSTNQRQEYSDYFVCDYTIYIKDEYLSQKFTASDFTKLATKDLTGGNKIFHLLANYTEKNEIIETLKSSMARKEVDKVTCEYVAYRVKTGEKNPVLPSIERKEIGSIEKKICIWMEYCR